MDTMSSSSARGLRPFRSAPLISSPPPQCVYRRDANHRVAQHEPAARRRHNHGPQQRCYTHALITIVGNRQVRPLNVTKRTLVPRVAGQLQHFGIQKQTPAISESTANLLVSWV